jgi:hypothetical protein
MDARQSTASLKTHFAAAVVCALLVSLSGCINVGTMLGKTLFGDPYQPSLFRQQTGVNLEQEEAEVALICTTSMEVSRDFDALHLDLQDELYRRLRRREIPVSDINAINDALASGNGMFDPDRVARSAPDARFLFHIAIERVSIDVPDSTNLRQGQAHGTIRGYEIRTDTATTARHVVQVFEHPLKVEYPDHPVPVEHLSEKLFLQQFIDKVTLQVGQVFYDVDIYDLNRD